MNSVFGHWQNIFWAKMSRQETRVMGLLYGEGCVILPSTVFD